MGHIVFHVQKAQTAEHILPISCFHGEHCICILLVNWLADSVPAFRCPESDQRVSSKRETGFCRFFHRFREGIRVQLFAFYPSLFSTPRFCRSKRNNALARVEMIEDLLIYAGDDSYKWNMERFENRGSPRGFARQEYRISVHIL